MSFRSLGVASALICACGSSPRHEPAPANPVGPMPAQPKLEQTMIPSSSPPEGVRIAPPGGAIHALAITPDGSAALTGDASGATRLWPSLDGSQEPRVVAIDNAIALAIVRRSDGYLVGTVDDNHGLTLALLDGEGRTRAHRSIGGDPSVVEVRAVSAGILAWTSDQKLTLYNLDGNASSTLAT